MIDRQARDEAALALRRLIAGQISNDNFVDRYPVSRDPAIAAFADSIWLYYSDTHEHRLTGRHRLSASERRQIMLWILFLDSNRDYVWPAIDYPSIDPRMRIRRLARLRRFMTFGLSAALSSAQAKAFLAAGHYDSWPFARRSDLHHALAHPRRLARRTAISPAAQPPESAP
nr:hypothetical protein [Methylobacterium sp. ZNC0032]